MNDFRELLTTRVKHGIFRLLKRIPIGNYELSIQASNSHYCIPRENLIDLYQYESMEVAVFKNKEWVNLEKDSFFNEWEYRNEFLESYDGMVAGCISIKTIQSLCDYIEEKSNA